MLENFDTLIISGFNLAKYIHNLWYLFLYSIQHSDFSEKYDVRGTISFYSIISSVNQNHYKITTIKHKFGHIT